MIFHWVTKNVLTLGFLLAVVDASFHTLLFSSILMQTVWVVGFVVGFRFLFVGGLGMGFVGCCWLSLLDCRYSLLGVRLADVWRGVGAVSTSAIFLLGRGARVGGGLVILDFLDFLVVDFRPRSKVFISTNFPSIFVNSFQILHFSASNVNFFGFLWFTGGRGAVGGFKCVGFLLNFWIFLGVSIASLLSKFSNFLFRCGLLAGGSKFFNRFAIPGFNFLCLAWWRGAGGSDFSCWGLSGFGNLVLFCVGGGGDSVGFGVRVCSCW